MQSSITGCAALLEGCQPQAPAGPSRRRILALLKAIISACLPLRLGQESRNLSPVNEIRLGAASATRPKPVARQASSPSSGQSHTAPDRQRGGVAQQTTPRVVPSEPGQGHVQRRPRRRRIRGECGIHRSLRACLRPRQDQHPAAGSGAGSGTGAPPADS